MRLLDKLVDSLWFTLLHKGYASVVLTIGATMAWPVRCWIVEYKERVPEVYSSYHPHASQ